MEEKNMNELLKEIKGIDSNVSGVLVPILKDTIADYRKIVFRLILLIALFIIAICCLYIYSTHNYNNVLNKYNDFLNSFEFETSDYVYSQSSSSNEGDSTINDGININQP